MYLLPSIGLANVYHPNLDFPIELLRFLLASRHYWSLRHQTTTSQNCILALPTRKKSVCMYLLYTLFCLFLASYDYYWKEKTPSLFQEGMDLWHGLVCLCNLKITDPKRTTLMGVGGAGKSWSVPVGVQGRNKLQNSKRSGAWSTWQEWGAQLPSTPKESCQLN